MVICGSFPFRGKAGVRGLQLFYFNVNARKLSANITTNSVLCQKVYHCQNICTENWKTQKTANA